MRSLVSLAMVVVLSACGSTRVPAGSPSSKPSQMGSAEADPATSTEAEQVAKLTFVGDLYDVPDPMPSGTRGQLMRLQTIEQTAGHRAYLMLYHSRDIAGDDIAVSGTLWLPASTPPDGGFPIVSFAPGTHDHFSDACPYSNVDAWNPPEYRSLILDLLAAGYGVGYTDYQGLGTRFPYTYTVGQSQTYAVLDAARAMQDLLGADASSDVFLVGHSVGAEIVMAALTFGPDYADGLHVRGVVPLDGYVDHRTQVTKAMANPGETPSGGFPFGVLGYSRAYPELSPADVLAPEAVEALSFFDTTACNVPDPFAEVMLSESVKVNPLDLEPWARRIDAAIPQHAAYRVFYPLADREPDVADREDGGVRVEAEIAHYPTADHYTVIDQAMNDMLAWMERQR